MAQVIFLVTAIVAVSLTINNFAEGFVLPHFAQLMGADYEYVEERPAAPTPTPNYIMRITPPSERRESGSSEITKVIIASGGQASSELNTIESSKGEGSENSGGEQQQRHSKTLTYKDLDKLLARWQLEKERNTYEMQAGNRHRKIVLRK